MNEIKNGASGEVRAPTVKCGPLARRSGLGRKGWGEGMIKLRQRRDREMLVGRIADWL